MTPETAVLSLVILLCAALLAIDAAIQRIE